MIVLCFYTDYTVYDMYVCFILACLLAYIFTFLLFRIVLSVFCVSQSSSCCKTLPNFVLS